jgi:serine/threonine protein kinase/tetratricopeptide (TPR) repeat protein
MTSPDAIKSVRAEKEFAPCPQCGATSRVGRGLCLNCLLYRGLGAETFDSDSLESVLDEVEVRDADWRLGNYQILDEIGRGGMGVIYRARQRHSRRIVALKRILAYHSDSRETLVRFRREAEAVASLDHPNILPIYEVGESEDGLPFFSMKFAGGGSLLESRTALYRDPRRSVALMAKVCRAVQYAHAQGILHRDLKPGNILLDGRGEPLVSDFGLAKWLDTTSDLTRTLTVFGTPGYIAPEQANGPAASLKPTADIYSLGSILFDLLSGRPPFLGEHALSVIQQAADKPAPKLRALRPKLDRDLETICARCLEREPVARYRSAGDLAEDLERWLEGRPIIARPVSPAVRTLRWSKRNPKLASSVAVAVVLGTVGVIAAFTSSRLSSIVQNAELARHSIVVTSFEDLDELSTRPDSAKAVASSITTELSQTKGIRASSDKTQAVDPWSIEDWKRIGEAAGARFVLSGSVRQREGKTRVALHLIEAATGSVRITWLQDVVVPGDLAPTSIARISQFLGVISRPGGGLGDQFACDGDVNVTGDTNNAQARSYYQRGKEFLFRYNLTDQLRAIESFRKAIEIDSNYAQAQAMLAIACQLRSITDPDPRWLDEGEQSAKTALRIAPMLPEAYRASGENLRHRGQVQASVDDYLTEYELDPASARAASILGYTYDALGQLDLALRWYEKAARRDTQPVYADNIASTWVSLGNYDNAEQAYKTAAEFRPDLPVGILGLSGVNLLRGDYETARKQCAEARKKYKDNPQPLIMAAVIEFFARNFPVAETLYQEAAATNRTGGLDFFGSVRFLGAMGFMEAANGHARQGKAFLEEARAMDEADVSAAPRNSERLYSLAADSAALGSQETAVDYLNKALSTGWIDFRAMELDPRFDSIRDTKAFKDILTRLRKKLEDMRRHLPGRQLAPTLTN